jgi:Fe-Mn family superoxide dismutase
MAPSAAAPPIASPELLERLARGEAPLILDVRRAPVFASAADLIEGASWRDPETVAAWAASLDGGRPVVVYCVHGHAISQGVAAELQRMGLDARYLEGGIEGWRQASGPLRAR